MAITTIRASIAGQWYDLAYNETTRRYEAELVLQGTSFHEPGGYYNVTVEAVNDSGTVVTTDGESIPGLRLVLRETDKPALALVSPPAGYVTTGMPLITLTALDSGSGVDISTLSVSMGGGEMTTATAEVTGGYQIMAQPAKELAEGRHTFTAAVSDYDGNRAELSLSYIVDTVPPLLEAQEADLRLIVDVEAVQVTGYTNDVTGPPVAVSITVNGTNTGEVSIGPDGKFDHAVPLDIGLNEVTVTAVDGAGLVSDLSFPVIRLITDRTEADLERLKALLAAGSDAWTAEEAAWFQEHILRGSYDYTDFNRVTLAMAYLRDHMTKWGYLARYERATFSMEEAGTRSRAEGYLSDVRYFRGLVPSKAPEAPADMEGLTVREANDIELILVSIDAALGLARRHHWGSGEIGCGEV